MPTRVGGTLLFQDVLQVGASELVREDEARRIAQQHHQESERQAIERSLPVGAMATMSLSGATHSYTHAPS